LERIDARRRFVPLIKPIARKPLERQLVDLLSTQEFAEGESKAIRRCKGSSIST